MIGLLAAVERFKKLDHDAERQILESRLETVNQILSGIDGVRTEVYIPEIANNVPHLSVEWNVERIALSSREVSDQLLRGDPPIEVAGHNWLRPGGKAEPNWPGLTVSVWMLRAGEPEIVAHRLREILTM